ncbi:27 kDa glycoprotein [Drosophila willistoni]|uniref:27 kDa glycoprotein n=1 Tax=Drosophila willistoni TaxID=7260 RepID=UPI000C26D73A|nr:27 kDa glycoprotein [Drosophila willistoni]
MAKMNIATSWTIVSCISMLLCFNNMGIFAQEFSLDKLDLPHQLPVPVPEELLKTNFSLNDVKDLFRNKCIEVSGEKVGAEAYTEIEAAFAVLSECINNIINYNTMQQEIEEASPNGELDMVFNKYCNRRSNAIECFETFTTKLIPCLDKEEQESQDVIKRIVRSLLNFVCHKDGDHIALFIAEKGPECFESKKDNIQQCINDTFSSYMDTANLHDNKIKSIPKLVVGQKQCDDIHNLESCIVRHLEGCSDITPANLVESMFNFIRNETLCRNFEKSPLTAAPGSSATRINILQEWAMYLIMILFFFKYLLH